MVGEGRRLLFILIQDKFIGKNGFGFKDFHETYYLGITILKKTVGNVY